MVMSRPSNFSPRDMPFIQEVLSVKNTAKAAVNMEEVTTLQLHADQAAFHADTVRLQQDMLRFAQFLAARQQNEKKAHLLKVLHLKQVNALGASLVEMFMRANCSFLTADPEKSDGAFSQVRAFWLCLSLL